MSTTVDNNTINSIEQLEALYGTPVPASLSKELPYISEHYRAYIEKCPFVVVATSGDQGLDCSPRGDPAGFVRVLDEKTVVLPDRRGNNRLDTLRNLVTDPRISLLFIIPGIGITMRINGTAKISVEPELLASFTMQGKVPASAIVVTVDTIYFQCPKALARSKLWDPSLHVDVVDLPTAGTMVDALKVEGFDGKAYDAAYPERLKQTIY